MTASQIIDLLNECSPEQREVVFKHLRREFKIHPLERDLNITAEVILEAFARERTGLTFRMFRGVLAEAAFAVEIVEKLDNWEDVTPEGDHRYDFKLRDTEGEITLQVKLQRSKDFKAATAKQGYTRYPEAMFLVETQKTRAGKDPKSGESTRSYRFGEFDILAVSLQPSSGAWNDYLYTVSNWLLPIENDPDKILKFQPVPRTPNSEWTNDFETVARWFRNGDQKTITY